MNGVAKYEKNLDNVFFQLDNTYSFYTKNKICFLCHVNS